MLFILLNKCGENPLKDQLILSRDIEQYLQYSSDLNPQIHTYRHTCTKISWHLNREEKDCIPKTIWPFNKQHDILNERRTVVLS